MLRIFIITVLRDSNLKIIKRHELNIILHKWLVVELLLEKQLKNTYL